MDLFDSKEFCPQSPELLQLQSSFITHARFFFSSKRRFVVIVQCIYKIPRVIIKKGKCFGKCA